MTSLLEIAQIQMSPLLNKEFGIQIEISNEYCFQGDEKDKCIAVVEPNDDDC